MPLSPFPKSFHIFQTPEERKDAIRAWLVFATSLLLFFYVIFIVAPRMLAERRAERTGNFQPEAGEPGWYGDGTGPNSSIQ